MQLLFKVKARVMVHPGSVNVCLYELSPLDQSAVWTRWDLLLLWSKSCASVIAITQSPTCNFSFDLRKPRLLISWHAWGIAHAYSLLTVTWNANYIVPVPHYHNHTSHNDHWSNGFPIILSNSVASELYVSSQSRNLCTIKSCTTKLPILPLCKCSSFGTWFQDAKCTICKLLWLHIGHHC